MITALGRDLNCVNVTQLTYYPTKFFSIAVLPGYRSDGVENIIRLLLFTAITWQRREMG
jgi:hypothetical protein